MKPSSRRIGERKCEQSEIQQIMDQRPKETMHYVSRISHGRKSSKKLDKAETKLDAKETATREENLGKEQREMQPKFKSREKKVDHLERAKRIEEILLLEKVLVEGMEWREWNKILTAIEERREAVVTRDRMAKMKDAHDEFLAKILARRDGVYLEKLHDLEKMLDEERAKRLAERKIHRKAERKANWKKDRAEITESKRLEELRVRQDEEKAKRAQEQATKVQRFVKTNKETVKMGKTHKTNLRERKFEEQRAPEPWQSERGSYTRETGSTIISQIGEVGSCRNPPKESARDDESKENSDNRFKRIDRANIDDDGRTKRWFKAPQKQSRLRTEGSEKDGRNRGRDTVKDDRGRNNYDMSTAHCLNTGSSWHDARHSQRPLTIRRADERIQRPPARMDPKLDDSNFEVR